MSEAPTGVLLVNLGTPDSPSVGDVRRYLREFLSDPLVIDLPAPARWLLLHAVILPFRPRASARAYAQIWTDAGSPLLLHGLALSRAVSERLGPTYRVELAMRYGRPSIRDAVSRLAEAGVGRIVALPLFPQYSRAASGSAETRLAEEVARLPQPPPLECIGAFYAEAGFVEAFASVARPHLERLGAEHVLFSYHGLPERQVRAADPSGAHCLTRDDCCARVGDVNRDCYRAQCYATTRALARALGLPPERTTTSFQSRLGRTPWIRPYTDQVFQELAGRGIRRLAVLCPAFVADCLETLEEIGMRGREQWRELGGEELALVPSLNAEPAWADWVAERVRAAA